VVADYDKKYQDPHHYDYKHWMFAPYVRALIKNYAVRTRSHILDLGCGTGFFSQLLCDEKMDVVGVDLSAVGLGMAKASRRGNIDFVIGSGFELPFRAESFDLIFCRGLSLYNVTDLRTQTSFTTNLFRFLREEGIFIFAYSSNLSRLRNARQTFVRKSSFSWFNHTLSDIQQHFSSIDSARLLDLFFLNRLELVCFGRFGLTSPFSHLNSLLTKATGIRGEIICVLEKKKTRPERLLDHSTPAQPKEPEAL
jgi:SAM-dependent methyltransferase